MEQPPFHAAQLHNYRLGWVLVVACWPNMALECAAAVQLALVGSSVGIVYGELDQMAAVCHTTDLCTQLYHVAVFMCRLLCWIT